MYGTGSAGGASNNGAVFKISNAGVATLLHSFGGGNDGANPQGVLILDKAGNIYGTTAGGGPSGAGTVFRITAAGHETVLYRFSGGADGSIPEAGLTLRRGGEPLWHDHRGREQGTARCSN